MAHIQALASRLEKKLDPTLPLAEQLEHLSRVFWDTTLTGLEDLPAISYQQEGWLADMLNREFLGACRDGDIIKTRFLFSTIDLSVMDVDELVELRTDLAGEVISWIDDGECLGALLQTLADDGELEDLQWVWEHLSVSVGSLAPVEICERACINGQIPTVEWLCDHLPVDDPEVTGRLFAAACQSGLEMAQWVHHRYPHLDHHWKEDRAFADACETGLSLAQWVYGLGGVDHARDGHHLWRTFVDGGDWEVAQWLCTLGVGGEEVERYCTSLDTYLKPDIVRHLCQSGPLSEPELRDRALSAVGRWEVVPLPHHLVASLAESVAILVRAGADPTLCDVWPDSHRELCQQVSELLADRRQKGAHRG